ncbi:MAG: tRNA pseudouridine32 synthase/23S rRNA pseudouridine746 synthase [Oceanicoccus sp.]|jgi:tRNA pseudouridine32 synthase/23S rRNA pseudouridine746 synthase
MSTQIPHKFERHFNVSIAEQTALGFIESALSNDKIPLSRAAIKDLMQKGAVWISRGQHTQRLRRAKKILQPDQQVHIYYDYAIQSLTPAIATLISDHKAYSIWHKPYGLYSQGSKWGDHCTINRAAEQQLQRPAFIVHRLDRATSGLIIVAHRKQTAADLSALFQARLVKKHYLAVVKGEYPAAAEQYLQSTIDDKQAISRAQGLAYNSSNDRSLVNVAIETGRKHQIRRQLSEQGYGIIGDRLYGEAVAEDENLKLCCYSLAFKCPLTGEPQQFELDKALRPNVD